MRPSAPAGGRNREVIVLPAADHGQTGELPAVGLDMGTFAIKGVLVREGLVTRTLVRTVGRPLESARACLTRLLEQSDWRGPIRLGLTGTNAHLLARELEVEPILEIEALTRGLREHGVGGRALLSLGHESIYYLEIDAQGNPGFFGRNGQCAAGSGAFWYQQATRMGFDDKGLAELAAATDAPVHISGRCAIFAKSDMTHAINEGATQAAVSAGLARTLADLVVSGTTQNRIASSGRAIVVGGVANNQAVLKYLQEFCPGVEITVPENHEYMAATGASESGQFVDPGEIDFERYLGRPYAPPSTLPPLDPGRVSYLPPLVPSGEEVNTGLVFLGVDCGSVSTKCVLLDGEGNFVGGIYLPTAGRPVLQVLELMKRVSEEFGELIAGARIVACTTGSGRFLSQKILNAEYAADEISCQAEAIAHLCGGQEDLAIIEIGGEDAKFLQLRRGVLSDYNMNPVCAAGTGTFLENLAGLLGISIEGEFSEKAFAAQYAIDLGDTCTLLSQTALAAAAAQGLPLSSQLASLAYASARNYLRKTAENRPLEGTVVFSGATAYNHALASAFAMELGREIFVPPSPELSGALGCALAARRFHGQGRPVRFGFRSLAHLNDFTRTVQTCKASCKHEHRCNLDVIRFADGQTVLYGDRCGRHSALDRMQRSERDQFPDLVGLRNRLFFERPAGPGVAAGAGGSGESGAEVEAGEKADAVFSAWTGEHARVPAVGLARGGSVLEDYPFWAAFFSRLGARVVLSEAGSDSALAAGKRHLEAEVCYPVEMLVGLHQELLAGDVDFVFVPEVVDQEPLPWARSWPMGFSCPVMHTLRATVEASLAPAPGRLLGATLHFRQGKKAITDQLRPVARRILGPAYEERRLRVAVDSAYAEQTRFAQAIAQEGQRVIESLADAVRGDSIAAVFLGRPYTTYDLEVSKRSLDFARRQNIFAIPQELLLEYVKSWYQGGFESGVLGRREEFKREAAAFVARIDHVYPYHLQAMLSTAFIARYLNERAHQTGLPLLHLIFQDPFKCGPNAMLRHLLATVASSLRLTMDEHTAPAGMITRLEAFKNTCRARHSYEAPEILPAGTVPVDRVWDEKILVPQPSPHAAVFVELFRAHGVESELLPRGEDGDLALAKRYVNGEECLPMIQNMQDFLRYLEQSDAGAGRELFFQGWSCGPCRFGLYAPVQSLLLAKRGAGQRRVCSVKLDEAIRRFGPGYAAGVLDGLIAVDLLYALLHQTRPYERVPGSSDAVFDSMCDGLMKILRGWRAGVAALVTGGYLRPLEGLLQEAARRFAAVERVDGGQPRPKIAIAGEFYVRLDDRCNHRVVRKLEAAGAEVSVSPAAEFAMYTTFVNEDEAWTQFRQTRRFRQLLKVLGLYGLNGIARRDEARLVAAAGGHELHEPSPAELWEHAAPFVSGPKHFGGEPPMTIGRTVALGRAGRVDGALMVAPFNCMRSLTVQAQQGRMRLATGMPVVTVYYDGSESASRDDTLRSLVYQARQRMESRSGPLPRELLRPGLRRQ